MLAHLIWCLYAAVLIMKIRNTPLGWHSDDERLHGSLQDPYAILSLSMGCSRTFSVRPSNRRTDETHFLLSHGDLISMNGMFQKLYQHRYSIIPYFDFIVLQCAIVQCSSNA